MKDFVGCAFLSSLVLFFCSAGMAVDFEEMTLPQKIEILKEQAFGPASEKLNEREFSRNLLGTLTEGPPHYEDNIDGIHAVYKIIEEAERNPSISKNRIERFALHSPAADIFISVYGKTKDPIALRFLHWLFLHSEEARRTYIFGGYKAHFGKAASDIVKPTLFMTSERQIVDYLLVFTAIGFSEENLDEPDMRERGWPRDQLFFHFNKSILDILPILRRLAGSAELVLAARRPKNDAMHDLARVLIPKLKTILALADKSSDTEKLGEVFYTEVTELSEIISNSGYFKTHLASPAKSRFPSSCKILMMNTAQ